MKYLKYSIYAFALTIFASAALPAGVPFPALQFLIGNWQVEAKPGEGAAHFEFALDVQGKALVRHNHVDLPTGTAHDDLVVVSQDGMQPAATISTAKATPGVTLSPRTAPR